MILTDPSSVERRQLLERGLHALGLVIDGERVDRLLAYVDELAKWNASYNLTAVRDPQQMVGRHLLDALAVLPLAPDGASRWIDIGSGGGIPGLVLAIARPQWSVTVLDSNGKKARFLRHAARTLSLTNVEVIEARAEAHLPPQPFDYVISRAFASLGDFVRLTAHLGAPAGKWLAMKGKVTDEERAALPPDMIVESLHTLTVPGLAEARCVVVMRAVA